MFLPIFIPILGQYFFLLPPLLYRKGYNVIVKDKKKTKTIPWESAEHLKSEEDRALYLEAMI